MTLIVLSVAVIALLILVLAIYLFIVGVLLNRIADNLEDCSKSVQQITRHATVIGPGIMRINRTAGELAGALPLLYGGAESLVAKQADLVAAPVGTPVGVGYMDA